MASNSAYKYHPSPAPPPEYGMGYQPPGDQYGMGYQPPGGQPIQYQPGAYQPPGGQPLQYQPGVYYAPQQAQPVMIQPGQLPGQAAPMQWAPQPHPMPGVPPGLEYLTQIDQVLCKQKVELAEALLDWECSNKYVLFNSMGQQIYYAYEESGMCARQCCGPKREFTLHIVDNYNKEVMRVFRPFKCCAVCCWCANCNCCSQELHVEAPPGQIIAKIQQRRKACSFAYAVQNATDEPQLLIDGPCCCAIGCCPEPAFKVTSVDGQNIGEIRKQWTGFIKEAFTEADNFGVSFAMDLDVRVKAGLIGATFLIDFMAFEDKSGQKKGWLSYLT